MPEQSKIFTVPLTDIDRIKVRLRRDGHAIINFSVQYEALIRGHWRKITRYDNAHGSEAHRHVYYPNKPEYRHVMTTPDNNQALTEALALIKKNFMSMRENYIILIEKAGR